MQGFGPQHFFNSFVSTAVINMLGFGTQGTTLAVVIHSLYMCDCSAFTDTNTPLERNTSHGENTIELVDVQ
jgi:hypothetical protein